MGRTLRTMIGAALCMSMAGISAAVASGTYASVHTIGVISAVGQTLMVADNGFFNFSKSGTSVPISDWGLDDRIAQEVAASLSPRFAVKPILFDRSSLKDVRPGSYFGWSGVEWKRYIRSMGTDGVDAYVVVVPTTYMDPTGQTRVQMTGVGLFGSTAFAYYSVIVVDARSGNEIAHAAAVLPKRSWMGSQYIPPSEETGDPSLGDSDVLGPEQRQKAKSAIESLIDNSINHALADVDLVDDSRKLVPASPPGSSPAAPVPTTK